MVEIFSKRWRVEGRDPGVGYKNSFVDSSGQRLDIQIQKDNEAFDLAKLDVHVPVPDFRNVSGPLPKRSNRFSMPSDQLPDLL